jgi:hypothetical protein
VSTDLVVRLAGCPAGDYPSAGEARERLSCKKLVDTRTCFRDS